MGAKTRTLSFLSALFCSLIFVSGCNLFEGIDQSINGSDQDNLTGRGNIALDEGRYAEALDLYERAAATGNIKDSIRRGKASSLAGLAGFNMFQALQTMQNGLLPVDSSGTLFAAATYVKNSSLLEEAIDELWRLEAPMPADNLLRALLISIANCKKLVEKYDTNYNGRLDKNDQINFDTRDEKTFSWQEIYLKAISGTMSLEAAFHDLIKAFDGRGEPWVMISPISGIRHEGTFTTANRGSILAIADFADSLEAAQVYFDNSADLFKQTIIALDGAD
jgi:tetratricopeptide (TPR) repeat protein